MSVFGDEISKLSTSNKDDNSNELIIVKDVFGESKSMLRNEHVKNIILVLFFLLLSSDFIRVFLFKYVKNTYVLKGLLAVLFLGSIYLVNKFLK